MKHNSPCLCVVVGGRGGRWPRKAVLGKIYFGVYVFIYFKYLFVYLFTFGCVGSPLLRAGFL